MSRRRTRELTPEPLCRLCRHMASLHLARGGCVVCAIVLRRGHMGCRRTRAYARRHSIDVLR